MINRSNISKKTLLLLGAIAGAATVYYLRTPHGKKLTSKLIKDVSDSTDKVIEKGSDIIQEISQKSTELVDAVASKSSDIREEIASKTQEMSIEASEKISDWQKGINKANRKVQNGTLT